MGRPRVDDVAPLVEETPNNLFQENYYLVNFYQHAPQQNHNRHSRHGRIDINYGCLLVPAVILVWYYWVRRSASQVIGRVVVTADQTACSDVEEIGPKFSEDEDEFSTWYVRLVRLIRFLGFSLEDFIFIILIMFFLCVFALIADEKQGRSDSKPPNGK